MRVRDGTSVEFFRANRHALESGDMRMAKEAKMENRSLKSVHRCEFAQIF